MKVIVAEDDAVTLMLIKEKLSGWGYTVVTASNGLEVLELLEQHNDAMLFLIDWQMPELDGIDLCIKLKNKRSLEISYVIILTSKSKTDNIVTALESGADDFIAKPFSPDELRVRLKVGQRVIESESKLLHQAKHDPLTNVLNHRAIIDDLSNLWARSKRDQSNLSVLMMDIDYFKKINDNYGHQAGDYALKQFCKLVKSEVRPYDQFGRYGGEEFTVCLPASDAKQAVAIAERIRKRVENTLVEYDGMCFSMTVSIGISTFSESQQSYKEMLLGADKAAYKAKKKGRNCVVCEEVS